MPDTETKEYPPLTEEQKKKAEWRYVWRYVYPGLVLIALFLLPYDTTLILGIGMTPYALATYLLALKPSLVLVFSMQSNRNEEMHVPVDEKETEKYRKDGKFLAAFIFILAAVAFVIWFVRRSKAV